MSEETTRNLLGDDLRRILARLDSIDKRLDSMNTRLEKLEARAYDTKPIWENALKEIADIRVEMREGFEKIRSEMETGSRRVEHKIDILNQNILDVRADQ
jgi:predicted  nucleic acid-binding Zn-ribbon protein